MTVTLTPAVEALVQRELDCGRYTTPEQVIENAIHALGQEHLDVGMTPAQFQAFLDEGWQEAERGETVSADEARSLLDKARIDRRG